MEEVLIFQNVRNASSKNVQIKPEGNALAVSKVLVYSPSYKLSSLQQ